MFKKLTTLPLDSDAQNAYLPQLMPAATYREYLISLSKLTRPSLSTGSDVIDYLISGFSKYLFA